MQERGFNFKSLDLSKEPDQKKFDEEFGKLPEEEKSAVINAAEEEAIDIDAKAKELAGEGEKPIARHYQKASEQVNNIEKRQEIVLTLGQEGVKEGIAIEEELSPEIIEEVMDKVKDINLEGQALSHVMASEKTETDIGDKLKSIFEYGLLGTSVDVESRRGWDNKTNKNIYIEAIKDKSSPDVFFNILGRVNYREKIGDYIQTNYRNDLVFLFKIPPQFKEVPMVAYNNELKRFTYATWGGTCSGDASDEEKERFLHGYKPRTSPELGFRLSPRVPPRFFEGLVFSLLRELTIEEYENRIKGLIELEKNQKYGTYYEKGEAGLREVEQYRYISEERPEKLIEYAVKLASFMINAYTNGKENMLIPIYDENGNLWWPKQIKYEQVRKEFKEREARKSK